MVGYPFVGFAVIRDLANLKRKTIANANINDRSVGDLPSRGFGLRPSHQRPHAAGDVSIV